MPIVVAGLGVSLLLLLTAFGYLSLHRTSVTLVRSLFGGWADKKGFRKWFFKAIGLTALAKALTYCLQRVRSAISHAAAVHLPPITAWLNGMHQVAHETYKELGAIAHDAATAYDWVVRHTLPGQIAKKTAPIKANVTHATATAEGAAVLGKDTRRTSFKGIDKLRKELGLLAGILLGIDILVKKGHGRERHHTDHTRVIPAHTKDIGQIKTREKALAERLARQGTRLTRLEKLLGGAFLAGVLVRTIARRWPWLFCRNWKKVGNRVCGMHGGLLNFLLGLGGAMFVFAELCRFIETVALVAGRVLPKLIAPLAVTAAALCDGAHTAAPALPLKTTALPDVPNPLTIN